MGNTMTRWIRFCGVSSEAWNSSPDRKTQAITLDILRPWNAQHWKLVVHPGYSIKHCAWHPNLAACWILLQHLEHCHSPSVLDCEYHSGHFAFVHFYVNVVWAGWPRRIWKGALQSRVWCSNCPFGGHCEESCREVLIKPKGRIARKLVPTSVPTAFFPFHAPCMNQKQHPDWGALVQLLSGWFKIYGVGELQYIVPNDQLAIIKLTNDMNRPKYIPFEQSWTNAFLMGKRKTKIEPI